MPVPVDTPVHIDPSALLVGHLAQLLELNDASRDLMHELRAHRKDVVSMFLVLQATVLSAREKLGALDEGREELMGVMRETQGYLATNLTTSAEHKKIIRKAVGTVLLKNAARTNYHIQDEVKADLEERQEELGLMSIYASLQRKDVFSSDIGTVASNYRRDFRALIRDATETSPVSLVAMKAKIQAKFDRDCKMDLLYEVWFMALRRFARDNPKLMACEHRPIGQDFWTLFGLYYADMFKRWGRTLNKSGWIMYIKECYDWERMQYPREPLKKITSWIETMSLELPQPTNVIAPAAPAAGQAVEVIPVTSTGENLDEDDELYNSAPPVARPAKRARTGSGAVWDVPVSPAPWSQVQPEVRVGTPMDPQRLLDTTPLEVQTFNTPRMPLDTTPSNVQTFDTPYAQPPFAPNHGHHTMSNVGTPQPRGPPPAGFFLPRDGRQNTPDNVVMRTTTPQLSGYPGHPAAIHHNLPTPRNRLGLSMSPVGAPLASTVPPLRFNSPQDSHWAGAQQHNQHDPRGQPHEFGSQPYEVGRQPHGVTPVPQYIHSSTRVPFFR